MRRRAFSQAYDEEAKASAASLMETEPPAPLRGHSKPTRANPESREAPEGTAVEPACNRKTAYIYAMYRDRAGAVSRVRVNVAGVDMQEIPWRDIGQERRHYREVRIRSYRRHPELSEESKKGVCELHVPSIRTRKLVTFEGDFSAMGGQHQVCSILRHQNLVMLGTFQGHLLIKSLAGDPETWKAGGSDAKNQRLHRRNAGSLIDIEVSEAKDSICNALTSGRTIGGAPAVIVSNNDKMIKMFDLCTLKPTATIKTEWAVNHTSAAESVKEGQRNLLAVVGDSTDVLLFDFRICKPVATLSGHTDFSFSTAWHPSQPHLATGNQDQTCRIWDIRSLKREAAILGGRMASVRAVNYSGDGNFIAFAEAADFIHIHSTRDLSLSQEIDVFGELAGFQFSPDDESIFLGIADSRYGCIIEWNKSDRRNVTCAQDQIEEF